MPCASFGPLGASARSGQRRDLFDMMEQLAAMAAAGKKEVADVLFALVAVHGDTCAATDGEG